MELVAGLHPFLRQQTRAKISREAMANRAVVLHREQHVIAGGAGKIPIDVARRVTKQKSLVAAELKKLSHDVRVQQRAFNTDLRARSEGRVTVLRNDPRYPA